VESLQGQLLVSSPSLVDPNFRRTVVLVAHHDADGAMGLVLSRPSDVLAVDAVESLRDLIPQTELVHVGGPVQPDAYMVLAEFDDLEQAAAPIYGRVGFIPSELDPEHLSVGRLRVFAGYAGWGAGQLETELEEPAWIVVPAVAGDPFCDDPDVLWRSVLRRKGGKYKLLASMPFDPALN
jgi:putative transcriptional regulator